MALADHINKFFLVLAGIACLTCLQRPDYDLPLFLFSYLLWNSPEEKQKPRMYLLALWTCIIDLVWLCYWGVFWGSDQFKTNNPSGFPTFILVLSIIKYILKVALLLMLFFTNEQCGNSVKNIASNIKSAFVYSPAN